MIYYQDEIGFRERPAGRCLSSYALPLELIAALIDLFGSDVALTPPQEWALKNEILEEGKDFLICAPTNSGKTLVAALKIFHEALINKKRSVLIVPLKAIAEEKVLEFSFIAERIAKHGGPTIPISITTGDYQISDDFLGAPPPQEGQIVICTPERLEVMLRNPDNHSWANEVGAFVIDEFHLLGEGRRGATLESLITRLFSLNGEFSIIGLSATIGNLPEIEGWFINNSRKVKTFFSDFRYPPLLRSIMVTENRDDYVLTKARELLVQPDKGMLVFVYTKRDAEKLAGFLTANLPVGSQITFFHAGLTREQRKEIAGAVRERLIRVIATTTSLKMGVNFPVTDVIIRDPIWGGVKRLPVLDVLQMMGRAGRGDSPGKAGILCPTEELAGFYKQELSQGRIDPIWSQLIPPSESRYGRKGKEVVIRGINPLSSMILTEIVVRGKARSNEVSEFISRTYAAATGRVPIQNVNEVISRLESDKQIFQIEGSEDTYAPTRLGRTISLTGVSPESGAVLAGFLRALIKLSEKHRESDGLEKKYLFRLTGLDFLFLALIAFECREDWLSKPSIKAVTKVKEYIETLEPEDKPLVNLWRSEDSKLYPTRRLMATLRIWDGKNPESSESTFYRILQTAILLQKHSRGARLDQLASEYRVEEGILENSLKFSVIWVLNTLSQICDPNKCYKLESLKMKIIELMEDLRFGATLGKLMTLEGIGRRTIEKLLNAGYKSLDQLNMTPKEKLLLAGLTRSQLEGVMSFIKRRSR